MNIKTENIYYNFPRIKHYIYSYKNYVLCVCIYEEDFEVWAGNIYVLNHLRSDMMIAIENDIY